VHARLPAEDVTRRFTWRCDEGILDMRRRDVRILVPAALQRLAAGGQRSRA
jgi:hypothetical protein